MAHASLYPGLAGEVMFHVRCHHHGDLAVCDTPQAANALTCQHIHDMHADDAGKVEGSTDVQIIPRQHIRPRHLADILHYHGVDNSTSIT